MSEYINAPCLEIYLNFSDSIKTALENTNTHTHTGRTMRMCLNTYLIYVSWKRIGVIGRVYISKNGKIKIFQHLFASKSIIVGKTIMQEDVFRFSEF